MNEHPGKLILRNNLSPGDITMLTAAVRDLHHHHPGRFLTDVRTPCPALWENNPLIHSIDDKDEQARVIDCEYPLIHRSNEEPYHFVHGYTQFLSEELGLPMSPSRFKGDVYISDQEKQWISQVHEIVKSPLPFWIIVAGGKRDYTIKWWHEERFQKVVDYFQGKILFVQVGETNSNHYHPDLKGVIDLRGKTDLRQLIRLVYHSAGVVCPVTLMMHLAAAVEMKNSPPKNRPCVVVAGGREPPHWEAYPSHQFLHTVGALPCCDNGGCWKSRTVPLGDGDEKDKPGSLCIDVVDNLPKCMHMISPEQVTEAVEKYLVGGTSPTLNSGEWDAARQHLT